MDRPSSPSALASLAINAQGFAFNPATGTSYTLNPTGQLLVEGLREGLDDAALAQRLTERFGIPIADSQRDVAEFTAQLATHGLV